MNTANRERLHDLLAARALEGLSGAEAVEMRELLAQMPDEDDTGFDRAVAALDAVGAGGDHPVHRRLPPAVAREVVRHVEALAEADLPVAHATSTSGYGWWAAAAAVVVAVAGWWGTLTADDFAGPPATSLQARVDRDPGVGTWDWEPTEDPTGAGVTGEVRWSQAQNTGYMRFFNLPANDPSIEQYQLWIFDETRDERYPVDGGVFDVATSGEAVVPISPSMPIGQPRLWAVTVEQPGGVVVSDRERLVLVAQVP